MIVSQDDSRFKRGLRLNRLSGGTYRYKSLLARQLSGEIFHGRVEGIPALLVANQAFEEPIDYSLGGKPVYGHR
jgi:hypothetical protein